MPILDFNDPNPAFGGGGGGGEGGGDVETFDVDTSTDPVVVTLPDVSGLSDGYIVRVYDAANNASTNNITINDYEASEVSVISDDGGERWLILDSGLWVIKGFLPEGSPSIVADWSDLPTSANEGNYAYLTTTNLCLRWSDNIDPLDAVGRKWVPASIYDSSTGVTGVTTWLEASDLSGSDTDPIDTWTDRITGTYTSSGSARPVVDEDGGPVSEPCAVFDGSGDYMASSNLTIAKNLSSATLLMVARPTSASAKTWYHAANNSGTPTSRLGAYGPPGSVAGYFRPSDGSQSATVTSVQTQNSWGLLTYHANGTASTNGIPARTPSTVDIYTGLGATGSTPNTDSALVWLAAYDSGGGTPADTFAGGIASVMILGNSTAGKARDVSSWFIARFNL